MWAPHHTAASHWVWRDKSCSRSIILVNNGGGTCILRGGLRPGDRNKGILPRRSGNLALPAAFGGNSSSTSCSNVMLSRNSRITCHQDCIVLVPVTTIDIARRSHIGVSSSLRQLNLRLRLEQGGSHVCSTPRVLKACLASPNNGVDAALVSDDGREQEVPANSLEFTHKVALDVLAPPDLVWKLWTDIKSAPIWMRWIDRVEFLEDDASTDPGQDLPSGLSQLSRWICSTIGFEVMWVARVEYVGPSLPVRVLRWATVEGLPSRGEVTFKENNTKGTTVELSISHSLPTALGRVMQSSALRGLVQATLQTDLECFQTYAAEAVNQLQLEGAISSEEDGVTEKKGSLTITTDCSQNLCNT